MYATSVKYGYNFLIRIIINFENARRKFDKIKKKKSSTNYTLNRESLLFFPSPLFIRRFPDVLKQFWFDEKDLGRRV